MGLVADPHMQRIGIGFRIDRDRTNTEPLRRAGDTDRDLPAIGDEH